MGIERRSRKRTRAEQGMDRRNFNIAGIAGAVGAIGYGAFKGPTEEAEEPLQAASSSEDTSIEVETTGERPLQSETNFKEVLLKDEICSGLACHYFELPSGARFPEKVTSNYLESLRDMWESKAAFTRAREKQGEERPGRTEHIRELGKKILSQYESAWQAHEEHEGIHSFRDLIIKFKSVGDRVHKSMDWDMFSAYHGIDDEWLLGKVRYFAAHAEGHALGAYSMTEIMPRGPLALREYEALIRNHGMKFANRIPALSDGRDSFGIFQLTEIAIDNNVNKPREFRSPSGERVAMSLNQMLNLEDQTPRYMREFATTEHHTTGALLFAIDNVARAAKSIRNEDHRIERIAKMGGETFASVLAAYHYRPGIAHAALLKWTEDRNWTNRNEPERPFHEFCYDAGGKDRYVGDYAFSSLKNYLRIGRYFQALGT